MAPGATALGVAPFGRLSCSPLSCSPLSCLPRAARLAGSLGRSLLARLGQSFAVLRFAGASAGALAGGHGRAQQQRAECSKQLPKMGAQERQKKPPKLLAPRDRRKLRPNESLGRCAGMAVYQRCGILPCFDAAAPARRLLLLVTEGYRPGRWSRRPAHGDAPKGQRPVRS